MKPKGKKRWGYDSRGIPFTVGCLPFLLFLSAMTAIGVFAPDLVERCVGQPIEKPRGKAGILYVALELACSPLLALGATSDLVLFGLLLCTLASMYWARLWTRKHQAHWDIVRAKEKERRKQKRLEKERKNQKQRDKP
jgi:hypothetical protein